MQLKFTIMDSNALHTLHITIYVQSRNFYIILEGQMSPTQVLFFAENA